MKENTHNHNESCCSDSHEHNHEEPMTKGIACPCGCQASDGTAHPRGMVKLGVVILGGIFIINSFLLQVFFQELDFAAEISSFVGAIILAIPIMVTAIKDLYKGTFYMNELVALAVLAAFSGGEFREAGIISFFLLLTIIIESRTASGAQRSIEELIKLTPTNANKLVDGNEIEVNVLDLKLDDIIRVKPGENFPIDGVIIDGLTTVNQASITGESIPADKKIGDDVFAGTQNMTGSIEVKVTKLGRDTTLSKVKDMIIDAEETKTPVVRIIDKYSTYYTPVIFMLAAVTWGVFGEMSRVITLLVIACPCAIVLATPSAVVASIAAAARLGILIKNVRDLERASKIKSFVFDKTGTLTKGILSVGRLMPAEGIEPAELLLSAASIEKHSNHPTAKALLKLAQSAEINLLDISDFEEIPGKGVTAILNGDEYSIGRAAWLESLGLDISTTEMPSKENEGSSMSIVYVAKNSIVTGWIGFSDTVRKESSAMIADLKALGIQQCSLVTGDRESVANKVGNLLKVDEIVSECLPEDKVAFVEKQKENYLVAVVGDGVNDAPALASGDLGIAMGAIGSDVAINSASIALMTNNLNRIPLLIQLSKKSVNIINQNLIAGLLFVIIGIILSVFGIMNPILGAMLHSVSTLLILFNSARLVRMGEEYTVNEE